MAQHRVHRLEENGVLQIAGIANPLTIGFDRFAMIGLKVRPGTARKVCRRRPLTSGPALMPVTRRGARLGRWSHPLRS
jgi:hypothetical protein